MNNLREVNDDILKEWIECRESTLFPFTNNGDKKHDIYFDEFFENMLRDNLIRLMIIFLIIFVIGEKNIIEMVL